MCTVNVVNRISCFYLLIFPTGNWGWLWPPLATPLHLVYADEKCCVVSVILVFEPLPSDMNTDG